MKNEPHNSKAGNELHVIRWRGRDIEIRHCRSWSEAYERTYGDGMSHLEVEVIEPQRAPSPFTAIGCRSHFTPAFDIEAAGGPVAYVQARLDWASRSPEWSQGEEAARQLSLF